MVQPGVLRPLSRFVLRAPVLPFAAISSPADARADLARLIADPVVREALYVASPDLDARVEVWQREPESAAGIAVERALVRYVTRMASRATPFGLFSAVAVGAIGETTALAIEPRAAAHRHTRIDNDMLFALCSELVRDPAARARLRYRPNSSLYVAGARLRYAEARLADGARAYHLVAVDRNEYVDLLLARAAGGASAGELVDALAADPDIPRDAAAQFVGELIDAQLLVAELQPTVTGPEPTAGIAGALAAADLDGYAAPLRDALDGLAAIDGAPPGVPADAYRAIERRLAGALPIEIEPARLFQVDLFKPAPGLVLGDAVVSELRRGVELLHAIAPAEDDTWAAFRERFTARYETREVPLVEVLDRDVGIGFGPDTEHSPQGSPLLAGLAFPTRLEPQRVAVTARGARLARLVAGALRTGATEIELTDDDIAQLARPARRLPDEVYAHAAIAADSAAAVAAGAFQLRLNVVGGGARLLGRFCHGSPDVAALTAECLRAEEARRPDAVFAEVVHLPDGRIGNVISRPVLRGYEIPYLGASGADADHQIPITDLLVSVADGRVVLRSRRLGREVLPRMTTAHNFVARSLPAYQFLCSLASQGTADAYWSWGALDDQPFLPRVRHGRVVLARARWLLDRRELQPIARAFAGAAGTPAELRALRAGVAAAVGELRRRLALPRWVVVVDGDNELPVDLDNELMVDSAAHLLKGRASAVLHELFPGPDQLCARGVEGAFAHELIVMFARDPAPADAERPPAAPAAPASRPAAALVQRRFLPGSSWLSLKLYTGTAAADTLLRDHLAPAVTDILAGGLATGWFFLRYGDPDWHLRVRFSGEPRLLAGEVLPRLHDALAPASDSGLLWRLVVDTYEREVERYGGADGIALAEQLFSADSTAALAILGHYRNDAGVDAAWRLALAGIDRLLDDFGLALPDRLALVTASRDRFGGEVGLDTALMRALGDKFRSHRGALADLLAPAAPAAHAGAFAALAERSRRIAPIAAQLRALAAAGTLGQPVETLVQSYIHMHVNRMIRTSQRLHELALHDLLRRHYDGLIARTRRRAS